MKQKRSDGSRLHGPRRIWVREFHWQPTMSIKGPDVARYADMFTALGAEPRLRIIRLLLSAHPDGMVVGDIQRELPITASNLSHHLEKLKNEELVAVRRDGTFLWCSANAATLKELLAFLYSECCTRNQIFSPDAVVQIKS